MAKPRLPFKKAMYQDLCVIQRSEANAARESYDRSLEIYRADPPAFSNEGRGIIDAEFINYGVQQHTAVLSFEDNLSRLRDGTWVDVVDQSSAADNIKPIAKAEIESICHLSNRVTLRIKSGTISQTTGKRFLLIESCYDPDYTALFQLAARSNQIIPRSARRSLTSYREISSRLRAEAVSKADLDAIGCDNSQSEAIMNCMQLRDVSLVQGPPGTGKTRVLAQIANILIRSGLRVGVCAYTNTAVDNALLCILSATGKRAIRAGTGTELLEGADVERLSSSQFARILEDGLYETFSASTVHGWLSQISAERYGLDAILVDEAAQIPVHLGALLLLLAPCMMLFGDDAQLGPIYQRDYPETVKRSLFSHFRDYRKHRQSFSFLNRTWRMNTEICDAVSGTFYEPEGLEFRIEPSGNVAGRRLELQQRPKSLLKHVIDPESVLVCLEVGGPESRSDDLMQAELIVQLLEEYRKAGVSISDIAVVTPFRRQVQLIRSQALRIGFTSLPIIDTVERMQGQERDIVIVSIPASDPEYLTTPGIMNFLLNKNRLNVTFSRAKKKIVVLLTSGLLKAVSESESEDARRFRGLVSKFRFLDLPGEMRVHPDA